ncbi:hypothetical protein HELRODRAFT_182722 [Helobdella robusta]|uniref:Ig-like domain-containing protein n=1 Tax=Helobdella robusta TaxID=6412 RepID=T1FIN2_HELRO|nr:hypothetical protein HELRODRAFT_182722 [Helobdella robusta]ESN90225.1 hypothetical protein HELRODRAFT_182722 [Helobdella robusta]
MASEHFCKIKLRLQAPEFEERIATFQELHLPGDVQFVCQHRSQPAAQVKWYKDDVPLEGQDDCRMNFLNNFDSQNNVAVSSLLIKAVKKTDEGAYRCTLENREGLASTTGYLSVLDPQCNITDVEPFDLQHIQSLLQMKQSTDSIVSLLQQQEDNNTAGCGKLLSLDSNNVKTSDKIILTLAAEVINDSHNNNEEIGANNINSSISAPNITNNLTFASGRREEAHSKSIPTVLTIYNDSDISSVFTNATHASQKSAPTLKRFPKRSNSLTSAKKKISFDDDFQLKKCPIADKRHEYRERYGCYGGCSRYADDNTYGCYGRYTAYRRESEELITEAKSIIDGIVGCKDMVTLSSGKISSTSNNNINTSITSAMINDRDKNIGGSPQQQTVVNIYTAIKDSESDVFSLRKNFKTVEIASKLERSISDEKNHLYDFIKTRSTCNTNGKYDLVEKKTDNLPDNYTKINKSDNICNASSSIENEDLVTKSHDQCDNDVCDPDNTKCLSMRSANIASPSTLSDMNHCKHFCLGSDGFDKNNKTNELISKFSDVFTNNRNINANKPNVNNNINNAPLISNISLPNDQKNKNFLSVKSEKIFNSKNINKIRLNCAKSGLSCAMNKEAAPKEFLQNQYADSYLAGKLQQPQTGHRTFESPYDEKEEDADDGDGGVKDAGLCAGDCAYDDRNTLNEPECKNKQGMKHEKQGGWLATDDLPSLLMQLQQEIFLSQSYKQQLQPEQLNHYLQQLKLQQHLDLMQLSLLQNENRESMTTSPSKQQLTQQPTQKTQQPKSMQHFKVTNRGQIEEKFKESTMIQKFQPVDTIQHQQQQLHSTENFAQINQSKQHQQEFMRQQNNQILYQNQTQNQRKNHEIFPLEQTKQVFQQNERMNEGGKLMDSVDQFDPSKLQNISLDSTQSARASSNSVQSKVKFADSSQLSINRFSKNKQIFNLFNDKPLLNYKTKITPQNLKILSSNEIPKTFLSDENPRPPFNNENRIPRFKIGSSPNKQFERRNELATFKKSKNSLQKNKQFSKFKKHKLVHRKGSDSTSSGCNSTFPQVNELMYQKASDSKPKDVSFQRKTHAKILSKGGKLSGEKFEKHSLHFTEANPITLRRRSVKYSRCKYTKHDEPQRANLVSRSSSTAFNERKPALDEDLFTDMETTDIETVVTGRDAIKNNELNWSGIFIEMFLYPKMMVVFFVLFATIFFVYLESNPLYAVICVGILWAIISYISPTYNDNNTTTN